MANIYKISGTGNSILKEIMRLNDLRNNLIYPIEIEIEGHHTSYIFHDSSKLDYFRAGYELASEMLKRPTYA